MSRLADAGGTNAGWNGLCIPTVVYALPEYATLWSEDKAGREYTAAGS
jgi:hypothetical protein